MEYFLAMKEGLHDFHYPNIHILNDHQITEIFNAKNREFLLKWLLMKINPDFELQGPNLSNLIHECGFCSNDEKEPFVAGTLNVQTSIEILYRMFIYAKEMCRNNNAHEGCTKLFTSKHLKDLATMDLNLFPENGPIPTPSDDEMLENISELEGELKVLRSQTLMLNKAVDIPNENISKRNLNELNCLIQETQRLIPTVNINYSTMVKGNTKTDKGVKFSDETEATVKNLNHGLKRIVQFQDDLKTIKTFNMVDQTKNITKTDALNKLLELCTGKIDIADLPNLMKE